MVEQLLGGLFGTRDEDDEPTRHKRAHDFIDRHQRGAHDQMSDAEVLQNYRAATSRLTPREYERAATEAFQQMSPEQRRELKRYMRRQGRGRVDLPDDDDDSPAVLAHAAQQAHTARQAGQEQSGLGGLLGFLGLGKPEATPARPREQQQEGGIDAMIGNPLVKIAIAGIAAMAAKKLTEPNR